MTTTSESTKWMRLKRWMSGEMLPDDGLVGPREEPGLVPRHGGKAAPIAALASRMAPAASNRVVRPASQALATT